MKYLIITMLSFISHCSIAQVVEKQSNTKDKGYSITISGLRKDNHINSIPARLSFSLFESFSYNQIRAHSVKTEVPMSEDGEFKCTMKAYGPKNYLQIWYKCGDQHNPFFRGTNVYLIEDGDSLQCELFPDSIRFFGKGADKMNIQTQLFKLRDQYNAIPTTKGWQRYAGLKTIREKVFRQQVYVLEKNRLKISPEMHRYLYYQCLGIKEQNLLGDVLGESRLSLPLDERKIAIAFYNRFLKENAKVLSQDLHICFYYMDYLYRLEKIYYFLSQSPDLTNTNIDVTSFVKNITIRYKGNIRDKLILTTYTDLTRAKGGKNNTNILNYIDTAINAMSYKPYKSMVAELKERLSIGKPAFAFSLPDSSGRIVQLNEFKGKVVLLDFWFTGCIPCRALSKKMTRVIKEFSNKDVIFVSISIDKDVNRWRRSILGGQYTHEEYINLYTEGKEGTHELIKHYNIISYPTLILIDRTGKLITSTPPNPREDDGNGLIQLIEKSL